jgi:hypothetical protein
MPKPLIDQILLSRPVRVFWAGWESDTFRLQQCGWKIAVKQDMYRDYYEFLFKHKEVDLVAMSPGMTIHQAITDWQTGGQYAQQLPPIQITRVARTIELYRDIAVEDNLFNSYTMIDARPQMAERKTHRLEDSNVFAVAINEEKEIVIDQADMTVVDHLQAIKELQSERQRELREKARHKTEGEIAVTGNTVVRLVEYK